MKRSAHKRKASTVEKTSRRYTKYKNKQRNLVGRLKGTLMQI